MTSDRPNPFGHRLATLQRYMAESGLDALLITNLINVRYLTGFSGTAGLAVAFSDRCVLAVDFRYASIAREVVAAVSGDVLQLTIVTGAFEQTVTSLLQQSEVARVGIEATSMTVSRFQTLTAALAGPATSPARGVTLVPTDANRRAATGCQRRVRGLHFAGSGPASVRGREGTPAIRCRRAFRTGGGGRH